VDRDFGLVEGRWLIMPRFGPPLVMLRLDRSIYLWRTGGATKKE
jgi:hypothetical protein